MAAYPLFDTGFIFWLGEVEAMVSGRLGVALKALHIPDRELFARYHSGASSVGMAEDLAQRQWLAAE